MMIVKTENENDAENDTLTEQDRWWWLQAMTTAVTAYVELLAANGAGASAARQRRLTQRYDAALDHARLFIGLEPRPPRTEPLFPLPLPLPRRRSRPSEPSDWRADDVPTFTLEEWEEVARLLDDFDPTNEAACVQPFDVDE